MQVYPVGCMEGSTPVYVHVAANSKQEAEAFVTTNRSELQVINVMDSTESVDGTMPFTVRLSRNI